MSEYNIVWLSFFGGLGLTISSLFYSLGGRSNNWLRRYIGSFIMALTINLLFLFVSMWKWQLLMIYPILTLAYCLPYGGENKLLRFLKRFLVYLICISSGLLLVFIYGSKSWNIFIYHALVASVFIFNSFLNPTKAAFEEFWSSMILNIGLIAYPFVN